MSRSFWLRTARQEVSNVKRMLWEVNSRIQQCDDQSAWLDKMQIDLATNEVRAGYTRIDFNYLKQQLIENKSIRFIAPVARS